MLPRKKCLDKRLVFGFYYANGCDRGVLTALEGLQAQLAFL